ncbi:HrpF protein [Erwinia sp. 198]|uniref:HrpF protein n=1 Tax=Erwinia sp. 198 TaxID=2022746 RepID=UPI000F68A377|nr:HrpF protein [Erwinia sp. 198]RRZ93722.1 HrpF protein [Erwinia sp. 198]
MSNDDAIQRRLSNQVAHAQKDMTQFLQESLDKPFNAGDMYAFQAELLDVSNANWASSQYTQYKHGIRKAIIDAIN